MRPRLAALLVCAVVLAAAAPLAAAQGTADTSTETPAEKTTEPAAPPQPTTPRAIPVSDIGTSMAQARLRLDEIRNNVHSLTKLKVTVVDLEKAEDEIDVLRGATDAANMQELTLTSVNEFRQKWKNVEAQLGEWSGALVERLRGLDQLGSELDQGAATWKVTRDSTATEDVPAETLEKIRNHLADIAAVRKELNDRRDTLLILQDRLSDRRVEATSMVSRLDAAASERRRGLFSLDGPPLWTAFTRGASDSVSVLAPRRPAPLFLAGLRSFVDLYSGRIILNALVLVVFIVTLVALRRQSLTWDTEDEQLHRALQISSRPVAVGLVLGGALAESLYPRAQLVVYELFSIVVLVASLRLVKFLMPPNLVRASRGLLLIVLAYYIASTVYPSGLPNRLIFIAVACIVLAEAVWWLARGHQFPALPGHWKRISSSVRIGSVLLVLSLLANIIGAVSLAETIARGAVAAAYWGVIVYVTATVLVSSVVLMIRSQSPVTPNFVRNHRALIQRRVAKWIDFGAELLWIALVLEAFRLWHPVRAVLTELFGLSWSVGAITLSVENTVLFFVTVWVATLASRFVRFVLGEDVLPRMPLKRGVPAAILMFVNYAIMAMGFILALAFLGFEPSQFALIGGALGVGLGFGLQTFVNNFVSGLILIFERPIQIGDTIEIGNPPLLGSVRSIGIRASIIRTWSGAEVVVPNGDLLAGQLTNWTLSDQTRRIEIPVGVAYGTDPDTVLDVLVGVCKGREGVLNDPAPQAIFLGFGDSSLNFELRAWANGAEWFILASELRVAINNALRDADITIPFPQRDLHLKSVEPGMDFGLRPDDGAPDSSEP